MVSRSIIAGGGRARRRAVVRGRRGVGAVAGGQSDRKRDYARDQQKQQIAQPLNNQPVWKEVRSGAPQVTTVRRAARRTS